MTTNGPEKTTCACAVPQRDISKVAMTVFRNGIVFTFMSSWFFQIFLHTHRNVKKYIRRGNEKSQNRPAARKKTGADPGFPETPAMSFFLCGFPSSSGLVACRRFFSCRLFHHPPAFHPTARS